MFRNITKAEKETIVNGLIRARKVMHKSGVSLNDEAWRLINEAVAKLDVVIAYTQEELDATPDDKASTSNLKAAA